MGSVTCHGAPCHEHHKRMGGHVCGSNRHFRVEGAFHVGADLVCVTHLVCVLLLEKLSCPEVRGGTWTFQGRVSLMVTVTILRPPQLYKCGKETKPEAKAQDLPSPWMRPICLFMSLSG